MCSSFDRQITSLAAILFLSLVTLLDAQQESRWELGLQSGALFPHDPEFISSNSPNGLSLAVATSYRYRPWLALQAGLYVDYFTSDRSEEFRSYNLVMSAALEARLHLLSQAARISPYLIGGAAPAAMRNASPSIADGEEVDPFSTARRETLEAGYLLSFGGGLSYGQSDAMRLLLEWRYHRFGFLKDLQPVWYRSLSIGLLLQVDWNLK